MNNKGQTLVLFVLLLPLLLVFSMMVLETGNVLITRSRIDSEIKQVIKYGLSLESSNSDEISDKIKRMLVKNIGPNIKYDIKVTSFDIRVGVIKKYQSLFPSIINYDYVIKRNFKGYISNDQIMIERE